jgi:Icc-related predicted phosphoesterase
MRLLVMSDLHLEFESYDLPGDLDFDVAIFAGDTWKPVNNTITWLSTQQNGALRGKPIVVVNGNHEYYGYELTSVRTEGRKLAAEKGIHLLDPGTVVIDGVRFIGATLWTDFALLGKQIAAKQYAQRRMNDYRRISILHGEKRHLLRPQDTLALHRQDRNFIEARLARDFEGPTVVVTHHAPHRNSVAPEFQRDPLSPAFASDLAGIIMQYQPALWVHGHDHRHHDYLVGSTRIVANPAGYPLSDGRENVKFDPHFIVEL